MTRFLGPKETVTTTVQRWDRVCDQCGLRVDTQAADGKWLTVTWPQLDDFFYYCSEDLPESPADLCTPACCVAFIDRAVRIVKELGGDGKVSDDTAD